MKTYVKSEPGTGGKKNDSGKARYDLIPVSALEALANVFTYGASKYGDNNWQKVESHRYIAALFRHIVAYRKGEDRDEESGLRHLEHAMTNIAILLQQDIDNELNEMEEYAKNKLSDKQKDLTNQQKCDIIDK